MPENLPLTSRPALEVMAEASRAGREVALRGRVRIPSLVALRWEVGTRGAHSRCGTEGFRVRLFGGRVPLRRFAPCVLRWKTLRVSSAPHPCGFESLRSPTKKRSGSIWAWSAMFLGAGTEGFEPPTAGTKNRSSTVELRPNVWCCQKQLV